MIVCFDIGSTLIDGPRIGPVRRLVDALELPQDAENTLARLLFTTHSGTPEGLAQTIADIYAVDPKLTIRAVKELWDAQIEEAYILAGAAEALDRLRQENFDIAFISNIWTPFYLGFLRCLPELAKNHPSFLSFHMGMAKPDMEIYRHALGKLGVLPSTAVMVGDTYKNDIAPAQLLGMKTIWLLHRPEKEKDDLVRVLNGNARPADLTLGTIGELQPGHIHDLQRFYLNKEK